MGWGSGSLLFSEIVTVLNEAEVEPLKRKEIYLALIDIFEGQDCDTLYEVMEDGEDEVFTEAFKELHPDYFEDDE
jgi:hypothetical protein